MHSIK